MLEDVPMPQPGPSEVLVRGRACGLGESRSTARAGLRPPAFDDLHVNQGYLIPTSDATAKPTARCIHLGARGGHDASI